MLVGGMVNDQIHDELHPAGMDPLEQAVKVLHGAELLHDCPVIADIIAVIVVRRIIDRRAPDGIDAQVFEVVELFINTVQVADPIAVGIFKGARIDLIEHGLLPPLVRDVSIVGRRDVLFAVEQIQHGADEALIHLAQGELLQLFKGKLTQRRGFEQTGRDPHTVQSLFQNIVAHRRAVDLFKFRFCGNH